MELILLLFVSIWTLSILYNLIHFSLTKDTDEDRIFQDKDYTFENVKIRLGLLEKYLNKNLDGAYSKLNFYLNNCQRTRRKFSYYSQHIEPAILKMYLGVNGGSFKKSWGKLELPIKFHFIFLAVTTSIIALVGLIILIVAAFEEPVVLVYIFTLSVIVLMIYRFFFVINIFVLYIIVHGLLRLFNIEGAKLQRNVIILRAIIKGVGMAGGGYYIAASGVVNTSSSDFGGFGGGSFGGGGAGGSW